MKQWINSHGPGILLCLFLAIPAWIIGKIFPLVGGAVIAILSGMMLVPLLKTQRSRLDPGIRWVSKKVLQWAVILLGFGLNLSVVLKTGAQSLPIIVSTIFIALLLAYCLRKIWNIPERIAVLVGVGSSICGGSAIAATAPVIKADDSEVAQAISVIFFFNVMAAILFPLLGSLLGMETASGEAFGIFAGTAVNDTSSVTACAATWDSMYQLGSQTLDKAVTVKLTRTLAIIPIVLGLAFFTARRAKEDLSAQGNVSFRKIFPFFILWFVAAALVTTVCLSLGVAETAFAPAKSLSKFLIIMAMAAIGLNTDLIKLILTGGKPLLLGAVCWAGITITSLVLQAIIGLW